LPGPAVGRRASRRRVIRSGDEQRNRDCRLRLCRAGRQQGLHPRRPARNRLLDRARRRFHQGSRRDLPGGAVQRHRRGRPRRRGSRQDRNDDPRLKLSGRIRFEGAPPPTTPFYMYVNGLATAYDSAYLELMPPDFAYEVSAVGGATPTFTVEAPPPFAILPFTLDEVRGPQVRNIKIGKGVHVSGRVKLPAGQPGLAEPMWLDFSASINGVHQPVPSTSLEAPDFKYDQWIVPGAWVYMQLM